MKLRNIFFLLYFFIITTTFVNALSDKEIKQKIIQDSISNYRGNCLCPYSKMKDGKSCNKFLAYSKKGAKKPLCYVGDVIDKMVSNYRK